MCIVRHTPRALPRTWTAEVDELQLLTMRLLRFCRCSAGGLQAAVMFYRWGCSVCGLSACSQVVLRSTHSLFLPLKGLIACLWACLLVWFEFLHAFGHACLVHACLCMHARLAAGAPPDPLAPLVRPWVYTLLHLAPVSWPWPRFGARCGGVCALWGAQGGCGFGDGAFVRPWPSAFELAGS